MTEPRRWSESGSEVDPVLRSVLRYARDAAPPHDQVRELVHAVRERSHGARPAVGSRHRRARVVLMTLAVLIGAGGAWAAFQSFRASPAPLPLPAPAASLLPARKAAGPARTAPDSNVTEEREPLPEPAPPPTTPEVTPPRTEARLPARRPPPPDDEVALLQDARRLLAQHPNVALALTRDHALRHPTGAFAEEREALAIEALRRMHRTDEADVRLGRFELAYPRSPYRRRLGLTP